MFIQVNSGAISGIEAVEVTAEINVAEGGLGLYIVGLPDNTIKESEERIQAAFENSGYRLIPKKTIVNLAPADTKKEGSLYDLPIAIGILVAQKVLEPNMVKDYTENNNPKTVSYWQKKLFDIANQSSKKEQDAIVESYEKLEKRIEMIMSIEKHYQNMLQHLLIFLHFYLKT